MADTAFQPTTPELYQHLGNIYPLMEGHGIERPLMHLVQLRASQINQCAFCVKMHIREAREDGETEARLDRLIVWRQVSDFTPAEKAAFAWTEALTVLRPETEYGPLREELARHFSASAIGVLTTAIGMINLWNRLQVSSY